jgi:two-component system nitrate/nitrite sensor histidine kinase NarX
MPGNLDPPNGYCLPLVHAGSLVATLHLEMLPHISPSAAQIEILNHIAPSMALAIDNARPRHVAAVCDAAVEAERRQIAQRLHDTLGQNLGYLHLKLDQLTGDDALREITAIQQELARMRDIANEAYNQVRETLATLHPASSADLATALLAQARSIGDQAGFEVELTREGQTHPLSPPTQDQILYLIREALTNVARHAQAQHVFIHLFWAVGNLTIKLADDGHGFEQAALEPNGHLGLAIMQERALQINGFLKLNSSPGFGTELTLRLPLDAISRPNGGNHPGA